MAEIPKKKATTQTGSASTGTKSRKATTAAAAAAQAKASAAAAQQKASQGAATKAKGGILGGLSKIAGLVPGYGTAISMALDAGSKYLDNKGDKAISEAATSGASAAAAEGVRSAGDSSALKSDDKFDRPGGTEAKLAALLERPGSGASAATPAAGELTIGSRIVNNVVVSPEPVSPEEAAKIRTSLRILGAENALVLAANGVIALPAGKVLTVINLARGAQ